MKNLERLLQHYQSDPRTGQILAQLGQDNPARLQLTGLSGALEAFVLAAVFRQRPSPTLIVAADKEEAAYLQNTIQGLLGQEHQVLFLPDSFKRPQYFEELNSNNVLMRTETVSHLSKPATKKDWVVTYPEALFEKVVDPSILQKSQIELQVGEKVDVDFLTSVLVEYGFKREEFVYEPGQFSIRGGIVDIFSYGNEFPYRVELFDEEVESIRTFDPLSQLSNRNIRRVSIIPNINTRFNQQQKIPFLQILKPGTVVWIRDVQTCIDRTQQCFEKAAEYAGRISALDESELAEIMRDRAFIRPAEIMQDLESFPIVVMNDHKQPLPIHFTVAYNAKPQPSFNKNFTLLINQLNDQARRGVENYIFTDNSKQIERFHAIFEDLKADVAFHPIPVAIHAGFIDEKLRVACFTDHQIFQRFHRYRLRQGFSKEKALNIRLLRELQTGDFVTHIDHGIGRYSGLEKIDINGHVQESVRLIYKNNDVLYVSINSLHKIAKYVGKEGTTPQLSKLGSEAWKNLKNKTKRQVKDIAAELIQLYAKRKASQGFAFAPDGYLQNELEASFIYEDTPDQLKATNDVKGDMLKPYPMDRLICGDVGFGKTEVAIRAAFKAVADGKQVAVLVPTTILALQHFKTFRERLAEFPVSIDYLNRFRSSKERKEVLQQVEAGKTDIIIGTHALLNKEVKFKDLGLLVIDEEQKFGVSAKERLRGLKVNVDTLTLTATPIPRTLQFSLMAARDLSVIRTPPPNRQPIHTEVRVFNEELVKDAIYYEVNRGGQVFFVHNRVKSLHDMAGLIQRLCPDVDVAIAHGQMESDQLERTLVDFIDGQHDVLVCTNIIETGLDIPNANTIIIHNAHQYGMSDLHQLRGRVGRSNTKAYCYLFSPPLSVLTTDARKRLRTLEEFSDLGSGFQIAMRDLDIRGAGNLLGAEQSGFINEIGFETYQKILEEAIHELKENEFKDLFLEEMGEQHVFVRDVTIDTDVEMLIPDEYVESIQERLNLYTALDSVETEEALDAFETQMRDRFGKIPPQVKELFQGLRLRWICKRLGLERVVLKNGKLRCYFIENPQSHYYDSLVFKQLFNWVGSQGARQGLSFKQTPRNLMLVRDDVNSLRQAKDILEGIAREIAAVEEVKN